MSQLLGSAEKIIGEDLSTWQPPSFPPHISLRGRYCTLEPLEASDHADGLWKAYAVDTEDSVWSYLPYGPFTNKEAFYQYVDSRQHITDQQYYAVLNSETQDVLGFIAYLRIKPNEGSIEIGCVTFSPALKKTRIATEAIYLLINNCFGLGYRRCEWKCNSLNDASIKAASRFGFQYEGCFRQAMVVKGKNRDTRWYSIIDKEWPSLQSMYKHWLDPFNFDEQGVQHKNLQHFI